MTAVSMLQLVTVLLAALSSCCSAIRVQSSQGLHHPGSPAKSPSEPVVGSVVLHGKDQLKFIPAAGATTKHAVAWASYVDSLHTTSNFGKLRIVTSSEHPDPLQMRAAGFIEGWISAERIYDQYINIHSYFTSQLYPGVDLTEAMDWLADQDQWVRQQVDDKSQEDAQWRGVGLVLSQFDGLVEGYQARVGHERVLRDAVLAQQQREEGHAEAGEETVGWLERDALVFLNNNGDLYDIIDHLQAAKGEGGGEVNGSAGPRVRLGDVKGKDLDAGKVFNMIALQERCSALIKVLGDLSDVLIGHSTWDSYTNALRLYKHYEFNLNDKEIMSRKISFSSYPGELFSDDDLYITDTRLVVVETTNHVFQPHLLDSLQPHTLPSWHRVRMAFMLADSGGDWVRLFGLHNSGTYNNQYMVVDLNRFVPKQELQSGFLWVVEQIPDLITAMDATQMVSYAYWPSFNVPYFEAIYNATGYPLLIQEMEDEDPVKFGGAIKWLKYQICPRAAIFRRDQGKVHSLEDMKAMMRYNNWRKDPYSDSNPTFAVCGRGDLQQPEDAIPKGCYDSKVTSYSLALDMESEVVNGPSPTADNVPFSWEGQWDNPAYVHRGHPKVFDFEYERMTARDLPLECDSAGQL